MELLDRIRKEAIKKHKRMVLPESEDDRVLNAAFRMRQEKLCEVTLLGDKAKVTAQAEKLGVSLAGIEILQPEKAEHFEEYVRIYHELRKHKGLSEKDAREFMKKPLYFGAMMVRNGHADGSVAGSLSTTGDVLRAAIHCIGLAENITIVSSTFLMIVPGWDRPFTFADSAVVPDPNPEELASIAIASAHTHERLTGDKPVVAMLSFSTFGSANHPLVDKVKEATRIVKERAPDLTVDGELQLDAAIIPSISRKKAPGNKVDGNANVLIFPNLDAGNISYKLTQRFGKAEAIGPIIQGLKKPANDLSRGCSVDDIVNVAAICCVLS